MDHINILKRAWNILWRYRALWIFGIILAMTATGGGSGGGGSNAASSGGSSPGSMFEYHFDDTDQLPEGIREGFEAFGKVIEQLVESGFGEFIPNVFPVIIALLCLGFILFVVSRIARWVSEVSLIRMVDHTEETGEQLKFKQGFKLGWSRSAWRLFLINLIIAIPVIVGAILLILLSIVPVMFFVNSIESPGGVLSIIATIGLFFLAIMVIILVGVAIGILERFFWRTCALEDKGVFESIREGFALVRRNLKDIGILWLIMVGVQIGFAILTIPVGLLLLAVGALLGGGVGLSVGALMRAFASGAAPWIVGGVVGLPILMLVMGLPMLFLSGLKETYVSTVWTLTYRELRSGEVLEGTRIAGLPEPDADADAEVVELPEPDEGAEA